MQFASTEDYMNLCLIHPIIPVFRFHCLRCNQSHDSTGAYADIDGIRFKAYYCAECAAKLKESEHGK